MNWEILLEHYGYLSVIVGAFFEGETVLMLGAYAVQQEILNYWWLILAGAFGAFVGDQFYYQLGAKVGRKFIYDRPKLAEKFQKASTLIGKYPTITILCMRFAWGLRTILPVSFGIKKFHLTHYILVNIVASLLWAFVIVSVGVKVSHWLHQFWSYLFKHENHLTLVICAVIVCIMLIGGIYAGIVYFKAKNSKV